MSPDPANTVFARTALLAAHERGARPYHEFLRTPTMSAGLYVLEPGQPDSQQPHTEDEIYVVLAGAARFTSGAGVEQTDRSVGPGDVLYVRRGAPHRFHSITQRLEVAVIFAPPEDSLKG